ncbi:MAG: hypothetical protein WCC95_04070 [Candidatus Sulfotelmatobacter sp.]|jgi:hypothetical protein
MKEVVVLLLLTLGIGGCGSLPTTVTTGTGEVWQSAMSGGLGGADGNPGSTGFSFITQFTVASNGLLSISNFELENTDTCFGDGNVSEAGKLNLTFNAAGTVTGTFSFALTSAAGDTVTLTSTNITGTYDSTNTVLTGGTIIGNWALVPGSSSKCVVASGPFTMVETTP